DGRADLVGAGAVDGGHVDLTAPGASAAHGANVAHADPLEAEEDELDQRMARELLDFAEHGPPRGLAVALDGRDGVLLETHEVGAQRPIGERDARAGSKPEAGSLSGRRSAQVV